MQRMSLKNCGFGEVTCDLKATKLCCKVEDQHLGEDRRQCFLVDSIFLKKFINHKLRFEAFSCWGIGFI